MNRQAGQAMAEYLVVASALMTAFFWGINLDCPGYDNCIDKLKTVMHDKYEGYSHSVSAVQQYGPLKGAGFDSGWGSGDIGGGSGSGGSSGGGGSLPGDTGLSRTDLLVSADGGSTYGSLLAGQYVVDGDGNVIGEYDGDTGTITYEDGTTTSALVSSVITDEDGNPTKLQAVTNCFTGQVYGFGYKSGVTNQFHNSLTLAPMDITGYCLAPSYGVVGTDGNPVNGAIVGNKYYASTLTSEIDSSSPQTPSGDVVDFDFDFLDDDENPVKGKDCAVMAAGWAADPEQSLIDVYLNSSPSPQVGSLDPEEGVLCPASAFDVNDPDQDGEDFTDP